VCPIDWKSLVGSDCHGPTGAVPFEMHENTEAVQDHCYRPIGAVPTCGTRRTSYVCAPLGAAADEEASPARSILARAACMFAPTDAVGEVADVVAAAAAAEGGAGPGVGGIAGCGLFSVGLASMGPKSSGPCFSSAGVAAGLWIGAAGIGVVLPMQSPRPPSKGVPPMSWAPLRGWPPP
jgi:hypothetical protein